MDLAHQILAQRQFNNIVAKFSIPNVNSVSIDGCSDACRQMLIDNGFRLVEDFHGVAKWAELPNNCNGGCYADRR